MLIRNAGPATAVETIFHTCRAQGRAAFIPFLMAGDPDERRSEEALLACAAGGADIIELGIPYSDPVADGEVIQRAAQRARAHGMTFAGAIELCGRVVPRLNAPLICFTYYNPVFVRGVDRTAFDLASAGFSGMIVADVPLEEAHDIIDACATYGLATTLLISPSTPVERAGAIARACTGFVYVISRAGVTGAHGAAGECLRARVEALRTVTHKPLAVGFGIGTAARVAEVAGIADGVVVGSALVDVVAQAAVHDKVGEEVQNFCKQLAAACRR